MDRSRRRGRAPLDSKSQRLRAAWMYFSHGRTQQEVAERLGISRSTVIRLLEEARRRREVRFWIDEDEAISVELSAALEARFGLDRAVVVPGGDSAETTARAVGLALGRHLSDMLADGMVIGVGWGRTLNASLAAFTPPVLPAARVVSLLGGSVDPVSINPVDYAWRLASAMGADCHIFPAPLVVDSAETKRRLVEACGLSRLHALAERLDLAVVSVGEVGAASTSLSDGLIPAADRAGLAAAGAVGDVMCTFIDARGARVTHPLHERVMSVGLDSVARAGARVLASGGARRAAAIRAAMRAVACTTLITDDAAARAMLAWAGPGGGQEVP